MNPLKLQVKQLNAYFSGTTLRWLMTHMHNYFELKPAAKRESDLARKSLPFLFCTISSFFTS